MAWRRAGEPGGGVGQALPRSQLRRNGTAPGAVDAGRAGVILGRRGRPVQRAVIGGLMVAAAAVIVFSAALSTAGGHRSSYVVAARPLAAGTVIGPGDTMSARLALTGPVAAAAFTQSAPLIGRTLAVGVQPGELIESGLLSGGGAAALRPVSIAVDAVSVTDLTVGQTVDVLAAPSGSSGASGSSTAGPSVTVVMRGATLLDLSRPGSGLLSGASDGTVVATLGVTDLGEAEQLVQAAHTGTVDLVRAEPSDGSGLGGG